MSTNLSCSNQLYFTKGFIGVDVDLQPNDWIQSDRVELVQSAVVRGAVLLWQSGPGFS